MKQFWLVKSEPSSYSWNQLLKDGSTAWTGVRNFQARNFLKQMQKGDCVLFYHSVTEKQIVGVARVKKTAFQDPTISESDWVAVELEPIRTLQKPVELSTIKADTALKQILLVRQSRLSVTPLTKAEFDRILGMSGRKNR